MQREREVAGAEREGMRRQVEEMRGVKEESGMVRRM